MVRECHCPFMFGVPPLGGRGSEVEKAALSEGNGRLKAELRTGALSKGGSAVRLPRLPGARLSATSAMPATPPMPADDYSLMVAIAQGDTVAFKSFYDRHSNAVYTLSLRMLKSPQEAEQLLTDVFFEIWSARERYDMERANPLTYLMRLTRSRAIDRLRRKGPVGTRAVALDPSEGVDVAVDSPPPAPLEASEERQRISAALGALDQEHRRVIECAYYDGLSHSEIAERLNKPLGTVKSSIRLGLARLKDLLRTP